MAQLKSYYRLCFAYGPFICSPGPGMIAVYIDHSHFRRWLCWSPEHAQLDLTTTVEHINGQLKKAIDEDDAAGGKGEWVGLLELSQGAKSAAALLFAQQKRADGFSVDNAGQKFRIPDTLVGRAPLVSLNPQVIMSSAVANAAQSFLEFTSFPYNDHAEKQKYILLLPTVHVHGRQNQGLHLYERLLQQDYGKSSASLVEWDGDQRVRDQRVPLKRKYVEVIVEQITAIVKETGVMNES